MTQLEQVKDSLGITGNYQDAALQNYIDEVKRFLAAGGTSTDFLESNESAGLISRGVADLWNYGAGGTTLSPYFFQRAAQVCLKGRAENS